jgi:hypothetical protein
MIARLAPGPRPPRPNIGATRTARVTSGRVWPTHAATVPPAEIPSTTTSSPNPAAMSTAASPHAASRSAVIAFIASVARSA